MDKLIVILNGGTSPESEVSMSSATAIELALQNLGYKTIRLNPAEFSSLGLIDIIKSYNPYIVFNALHGGDGENGRLPALLELERIPFTGSGSTACAITMDKIITSHLAKSLHIPVPDLAVLPATEEIAAQLLEKLPLVVKPCDSGSSVGITIAQSERELRLGIAEARKHSSKVMLEKFIPGRELTVSIIGKKAYPVVEIKPREGFYDYRNKYTKGATVYEAPAHLEVAEIDILQKYALQICDLCNIDTYARVDFRFDGKEFYFLEINTLPGMTSLSLTPMAAKAGGLSFEELMETIIELSLKK